MLSEKTLANTYLSRTLHAPTRPVIIVLFSSCFGNKSRDRRGSLIFSESDCGLGGHIYKDEDRRRGRERGRGEGGGRRDREREEKKAERRSHKAFVEDAQLWYCFSCRQRQTEA